MMDELVAAKLKGETCHSVAIPELAFGGLATALIFWSLLAIALAQLGLSRSLFIA
jgi:hypothetical protein